MAETGLTNWNPVTKSKVLLEAFLAVLDEYQAQQPLTLRQVFYRLVAIGKIDKTENAYDRILRIGNMGRRSGLISWDAIRDDKVTDILARPEKGYSAEELAQLRIDEIQQFDPKRHARFWTQKGYGQPIKVMILTESSGMAPMISTAVHDLGVSVRTSGGFDSVTAKKNLADGILNSRRPVRVLHIGDRDPSGEHLYTSLAADVTAFVADLAADWPQWQGTPNTDIEFRRIAVTETQIKEYDLPTAPPKKSDKRSFSGLSTQCEALPPDILQKIARAACLEYYDPQIDADNADHNKREGEAFDRWLATLPDFPSLPDLPPFEY